MTDDRFARRATPGGEDGTPIGRRLRDADPADVDGLDRVERAQLRATIVAAAERAAAAGSGHSVWWWKLAPVAAMVLVVAALTLWWTILPAPTPTAPNAPGSAAKTPATTAPDDADAADLSAARPEIPAGDLAPSAVIAVPEATVSAGADSSTLRSGPEADVATGRPATDATLEGEPPRTVLGDPTSPADPQRTPRTVQFTAPSGTRIIWTLDPNFESPIAGQSARQE